MILFILHMHYEIISALYLLTSVNAKVSVSVLAQTLLQILHQTAEYVTKGTRFHFKGLV